MKTGLISAAMVLLMSAGTWNNLPAQEKDSLHKPWAAVKTNALGLAAGIANIGVEFRLADKVSLHLPLRYSPYTIDENYRLRMLTMQLEVRYWFSESFSRHFIGIHPVGSFFNISFCSDTRYQTDRIAYGAGVSYGYSMNLGRSTGWKMEFSLGAGYADMSYDMYYNVPDGMAFGSGSCHYFGLTHASVNIVCLIGRREKR